MNPTIIISAILAAFSAVGGFGVAWTLRTHTIDELKLGAANERIAAQRGSRQTSERLMQAVSEAQADSTRRSAALAADADRSRSELSRLRDTSAATVRASADSPAACSSITKTYDIVFGECATRLVEVAASADQCISDNQTITAAWPK